MSVIKKLTDKEIDERVAAAMQIGQPASVNPTQTLDEILGWNQEAQNVQPVQETQPTQSTIANSGL